LAQLTLKQLEQKLDSSNQVINAKFDQLLAALAPGQKMPVAAPRNHLESEEMDDPNSGGINWIPVGDEVELARPGVTNVETKEFRAKADELAFMEEMVTIDVHPMGNREKPLPFPVYCNGRMVALVPGQQKTLQRKYVAVLAQGRPVHYDNQEYEENGVKGVRWPSWRGPRFPFSIVQDSDRGRKWFHNIMAAP
jgi:hypothetical protein